MLPICTFTKDDINPAATHVLFGADVMSASQWHLWHLLMQTLPAVHPTQGPWIAGGAVRRFLHGHDPLSADIDYFCRDEQQFRVICEELESQGIMPHKDMENHKTYQVGPCTVQVIRTRYRSSLVEHMDAFDFTICQTGWNGENFILTTRALADLQAHHLILVGPPRYPRASWNRVIKYYQQGFHPEQHTIIELLQAMMSEAEEVSQYT